jgi:hypothetical protein
MSEQKKIIGGLLVMNFIGPHLVVMFFVYIKSSVQPAVAGMNRFGEKVLVVNSWR